MGLRSDSGRSYRKPPDSQFPLVGGKSQFAVSASRKGISQPIEMADFRHFSKLARLLQ
jgi:hypothetical protein